MHPRHTHPSAACFLLGLASAALLFLTGGCTLLKPARNTGRYYILTATGTSVSGTIKDETHAAGCRVRIQSIELAEYLRTRQMVVRTGANGVTFALFHQWAEPLDAGLRRVLAEDLRRSPVVQDVVTEPGPREAPPGFTLSIHVTACEGILLNGHGAVRLEAVWRLAGPNAILEQGMFHSKPAAWDGQDYEELAGGLSRAAGDLAGVVLDALSREAGKR